MLISPFTHNSTLNGASAPFNGNVLFSCASQHQHFGLFRLSGAIGFSSVESNLWIDSSNAARLRNLVECRPRRDYRQQQIEPRDHLGFSVITIYVFTMTGSNNADR